MLGKPVISGTRITVEHIFELLAAGETKKTIVKNYPYLQEEDITACIRYATKLIQEKNTHRAAIELQ